MRGLIREAVALCCSPMEGVLAQVHEALLQGAELAALRCASDAAGRRESDTAELAEGEAVRGASSAAGDGLDELMHWLEQRAKSCIDRHRQEASRLLDQLLESEAGSPCPGGFAALKLRVEGLLHAVGGQEQGVAEAALGEWQGVTQAWGLHAVLVVGGLGVRQGALTWSPPPTH